ncbi:MAG TPA: 6-phosphogluconolactonase [Ktedonobacterales bacterium]|nr:6-phosphogluconolactonase [Ktedonobacterales bacterium]
MSSAAGNRVHLEVLDNLSAIAARAADLFVCRAREASASDHFTVALSGGSTPKALHNLLAAPPYRDQVDWSRVEFYWGDDRTVAPDDPESNFRMARETLLDKLPIRETQIHRIHTELAPTTAAALYEDELRQEFQLSQGQLPRLDLIYLGMGPDGHTASLFPHTAALGVTDRLVTANEVPQLSTTRITLTAPVLNNAATIAFLVAGADKAGALAAVLEGPRDPDTYPSQRIAPTDGDLYWLVDRAAATKLTRT